MLGRRRTDKRRRLTEQPVSRLFPNMVTLAGLCCGLSAIRFALLDKWELSVSFIIAAALIDGMDGRIARMLGATSLFGAQLDSLSDFVCFGIAPALILYMWQLHDIHGIGWAVTLFFCVCTALRLARFNTGLFDDNTRPWEKKFFVGVPSPAGGILCLLPLVVALQYPELKLPTAYSAVYIVMVGTLMASRIPTFSGKKVRIKHEMIPFFMLGGGAVITLFIIEPWMSIMAFGAGYLCSIPISSMVWKRYKKADALAATDFHYQGGEGQ